MTTNKSQLIPFVTNLNRNVFCLKNLPEVIKGALFSRYSRSDKDLRTIFLDEFLNAPETSFQGSSNTSQEGVNTPQAEAFYDRVLLSYGDDSIAELGGAHIACEWISNIAAKALEDSRIGISPLEKSTRYVRFDQQKDGKYLYYREPLIMLSAYCLMYESAMDGLFKTYSDLIEPLSKWLASQYPKDEVTTERAYANSIKAKALDILRGLLPMATQTNVGLYGNGRAFEHLLIKLSASPHLEVRELGRSMQEELMEVIPSFVKRATTDRGRRQSGRIMVEEETVAGLKEDVLSYEWSQEPVKSVQLVEYDNNAENKVVAAILYTSSLLSFSSICSQVFQLPSSKKEEVIQAYLGDRETRFDKVGRAFEEVYYTFDILADIGAYRDLQRHRILSREHQAYTVNHGYDTPQELIEAGLDGNYRRAIDYVSEIYGLVSREFSVAAQYMVPMACKIRWRITLNLREAYHFIELRSSRQGHPSYRKIAQEMYRQIQQVHPTLVEGMLVDMNDYGLERLVAEQKTDKKMRDL